MKHIALLPGRAVLEVAGEDRVSFLQGLVSNDVAAAVPGLALWSALLTPQGKYLADFFIIAEGDRLLLDVQADQAAMLPQKLSRFRLRARVAIAPANLLVYAGWGEAQEGPAMVAPGLGSRAVVAADARLPDAGWRVLSETELAATDDFAAWDRHRLALGLPDGTRDLEVEKTVLLEAGFEELGGVSFTKGCFLGQELTARTRYRGLLKRRLVPVQVDGTLPPPGMPVLRDGAEVGTMRSGRDSRGLAVLRLEAIGPNLRGDGLRCGDALLTPAVPAWLRLPQPPPGS